DCTLLDFSSKVAGLPGKLEQSPRRTPPGLGALAAALSTEVEPINNKRAGRAVKAKARPRGENVVD
ncbi:hypothetical protein, partial [Bradyrhizobium sp.]|uniref:hypothetical protein n=1 Tax=Bradyrhizobium sp. TaxID=376 RepID=UPI003C755259